MNIRTLSKSLVNLTKLRKFGVSYCGLEEFPEVITQVTTLQELVINRNENIHTLPKSLANLTKLRKFDASRSGLTSFPDILTELRSESLILSDMADIKLLPSSLAQLSKLKTLDVSRCRLKEVPEAISGLKQLYDLNLGGNEAGKKQWFIQTCKKTAVLNYQILSDNSQTFTG